MDLIEIYRTFQSNTEDDTFFSASHGMSSKVYYKLGYHQISTNMKENEKNFEYSIWTQQNKMKYQWQ